VLLDWFRHPHKKFGTNYRIVNLVAGLQIATIILSRGNMYVLGEAYAFGVIWSFVFKTLSVIVLRYKSRYHRLWRMPPNLSFLRPGGTDLPIGLIFTFLVLLATASVNLFTKEVATISGIIFTLGFFVIFSVSQHVQGAVEHAYGEEPEKFNLELVDESELVPEKLGLNGGEKKIIAIRDPNNLAHLHRYLAEPDDAALVALTVRLEKGLASSDGGQVFNDAEVKLFSRVVKVCEDHGRKVAPLVIVSNDQVHALARAAYQLRATEVVMGVSARFHPDVQLENFAMHWGTLAGEDQHVKVRVLSEHDDIRADV
jgi:hypothetical protein